MTLTRREELIIATFQQQDFCFYKDIRKTFFSSDTFASPRLKKLKEIP